jgi:hypothetical protein
MFKTAGGAKKTCSFFYYFFVFFSIFFLIFFIAIFQCFGYIAISNVLIIVLYSDFPMLFIY